MSVCPADILVFYFSAIRRDIDLKFIQDTYRVVLNSLKNDLHRSKVKVTGTVHRTRVRRYGNENVLVFDLVCGVLDYECDIKFPSYGPFLPTISFSHQFLPTKQY